MQKLSFSTNWNNKLNNDYFTTIRLSGRLEVNEVIEVEDRGTSKGQYKVISKKRLFNIHLINDWMAFLDTGYNAEETRNIIRRMYKDVQDWDNQPIYYYLIGKIRKQK